MFNYIKFWMFLSNQLWEWWAEMETRVTELRNKFEKIKSWEVNPEGISIKDWDPKDNYLRELAKQIRDLQIQLAWAKASQWLSSLLTEVNTEIKKVSPKETEELKNIDNKSFLKVPWEKRLQYLTKWSIDSSDVSSWQVKELEFTFTFDWVFNEQLYLRTTAWQLLPKEVWTVTLWDIVYSRKWLSWEFFSQDWNRLIIHEWTKVQIWNLRESWEIERTITENLNKSQDYLSNNPWSDNDVTIEAINRWIDPKLANLLFKDELVWLDSDTKKVEIESKLTQFSRVMDYFIDDYHKEAIDWWYTTKEFLAYYLSFEWYSDEDKNRIFEGMWYDKSILNNFKRKEIVAFSWETLPDEKKREILDKIKDIPSEFTSESFWTQFIPWSAKAKELFMYASKVAWLPSEWAESKSLHELLKHESVWRVWVMNYAFKRSAYTSMWNFKDYVTENLSLDSRKISKNFWTISNASWLWQLLISNVDKFYPEWREWIWKPLNEAVWMIKYIEDRYWHPDIAWEMYWKTWPYIHPTKWQQYKSFKEWY